MKGGYGFGTYSPTRSEERRERDRVLFAAEWLLIKGGDDHFTEHDITRDLFKAMFEQAYKASGCPILKQESGVPSYSPSARQIYRRLKIINGSKGHYA